MKAARNTRGKCDGPVEYEGEEERKGHVRDEPVTHKVEKEPQVTTEAYNGFPKEDRIIIALIKKDEATLKKLLQSKSSRANLGKVYGGGLTPLIIACQGTLSDDLITMILALGAKAWNAGYANKAGKTALMFACENRHSFIA